MTAAKRDGPANHCIRRALYYSTSFYMPTLLRLAYWTAFGLLQNKLFPSD
jgi:hypothetical protein